MALIARAVQRLEARRLPAGGRLGRDPRGAHLGHRVGRESRGLSAPTVSKYVSPKGFLHLFTSFLHIFASFLPSYRLVLL